MKKLWLLSLATVLGHGALAAKDFKIDGAHSTVGFSVKHLGVSNVKGIFKDFEGDVNIDPKTLKPTKIVGTVTATSIDTRNDDRDKHLKSPDFFDVDKDAANKKITFKMKKFEGDKGTGKIIGDLTMKGVTKEVTLDSKISDVIQDPFGNDRVAISAKGAVNRQDFGINFNKTFGKTGDLVVANNVDLELDIEATAPSAKKK